MFGFRCEQTLFGTVVENCVPEPCLVSGRLLLRLRCCSKALSVWCLSPSLLSLLQWVTRCPPWDSVRAGPGRVLSPMLAAMARGTDTQEPFEPHQDFVLQWPSFSLARVVSVQTRTASAEAWGWETLLGKHGSRTEGSGTIGADIGFLLYVYVRLRNIKVEIVVTE